MQRLLTVMVLCGCLVSPTFAQSPSLKGSKASVNRMAEQGKEHDFTRLPNEDRLGDFVKMGLLVRLPGNRDYHLAGISHPFVRPEVKIFVERFSHQAQQVCHGDVWVTSATRPLDEQPRNASSKSVHPQGMAVDFRVPRRPRCRAWFEKTFLELEGKKVLEATRERSPRHYHVAVFPDQYSAYVNSLGKRKPSTRATKKK